MEEGRSGVVTSNQLPITNHSFHLMSKIKYHCEFCNEGFDGEADCLKHEETHGSIISCIRIVGEKRNECQCNVVRYSNFAEIIWSWSTEHRKISYEFQLTEEEIHEFIEALRSAYLLKERD